MERVATSFFVVASVFIIVLVVALIIVAYLGVSGRIPL
jgi:hypothetical protein